MIKFSNKYGDFELKEDGTYNLDRVDASGGVETQYGVLLVKDAGDSIVVLDITGLAAYYSKESICRVEVAD